MSLSDLLKMIEPYRDQLRRLAPSVGALIAVIVIFGGLYWYLSRQSLELADELETLEIRNNRIVSAIRELRGDSELVNEQLYFYRQIEAMGLFEPKAQSEAALLLNRLANTHKINDVAYEFDIDNLIALPTQREIDANIYTMAIRLEIRALNDADIFRFLDAFIRENEGIVTIRSMTLTRTDFDLTRRVREIERQWRQLEGTERQPERPDLVSASVTLDWTTMSLTEPEGAS